jgi:predicted naringenin-chalcone synthase
VATGSCLIPDALDAMTWTIGDHGFEMSLSPRVPSLLERHLGAWFVPWLGEQGLTPGDVGGWAVHPGGPRILGTVAGCLGLPDSALRVSRGVLAEHGNMSSPTVLFIAERLGRERVPLPWVLIAFGPGLVAEVALIR